MRTRTALLTFGYAALIVYGSLFPFTGWTGAETEPLGFLTANWRADYSTPDVLANVLAYMPFGLLLALCWRGSGSLVAPVILATMAGGALSFFMELLQQFMPSRVASVMDLMTNVCGTFTGAILAGFTRRDRWPGSALTQWRARWIKPGRLFDLGLSAIGVWTLSQLMPLVLSLELGNLRHGLSPLWQTVQHPENFNYMQWAVYALSIAGLGLLSRTLGNPGRRIVAFFFAFVAAMLVCKIAVVSRQLSLEAVAGALTATALAPAFLALRARAIAYVSAVLILGAFTCAELASSPSGDRHAFNWVAFRGQTENPLVGIASILENIWPGAALAYLARFATVPMHRQAVAWIGGALLACVAFALEWYQQFLPGRYGDITTVFLIAAAWLVFQIIPLDRAAVPAIDTSAPSAPPALSHLHSAPYESPRHR